MAGAVRSWPKAAIQSSCRTRCSVAGVRSSELSTVENIPSSETDSIELSTLFASLVDVTFSGSTRRLLPAAA